MTSFNVVMGLRMALAECLIGGYLRDLLPPSRSPFSDSEQRTYVFDGLRRNDLARDDKLM